MGKCKFVRRQESVFVRAYLRGVIPLCSCVCVGVGPREGGGGEGGKMPCGWPKEGF